MRKIKVYLSKLLPKLFRMNYYDEDDLYYLTNHLTQNVFPKNGTVIGVPITVDNTINCLYYVLTFPDRTTMTLKIGFNPDPYLELVNTDVINFIDLCSIVHYTNHRFIDNRVDIGNFFLQIRNTKEQTLRIGGR